MQYAGFAQDIMAEEGRKPDTDGVSSASAAEGAASASCGRVEPGGHRMHCTAKCDMTEPRVANGAPYRLHVILPADDGSVPECGCGMQHVVYGRTYRYCTCGLSEKQVSFTRPGILETAKAASCHTRLTDYEPTSCHPPHV
jgi:hypothetical protein